MTGEDGVGGKLTKYKTYVKLIRGFETSISCDWPSRGEIGLNPAVVIPCVYVDGVNLT